ncbi:MAG: hypothetical protein COW12_04355, partial [Candidatus Omnitrophica bacterium CG12_big_fil_rev_8_21_14_0_65_45_16]
MDLPAVPLALAGSDSFHGSAQEFVLPQNRGNIEFRSLSKKPLQVILVQDAHGIPDAQRGLARVLDYAANHYGVSTVGVEGVSGPLTAEFFQAVPEQEKLKAILKEDLRRGELSGIVWEAIFGNPSVSYIGIEDHKLFNQGLSLYLQAQGQQASDLEWLQSFKSRLEEYKKGVYTPDLLKADQLTETLSEGYKNLGPFLIEMGKFLLPNEGSSVDLLRRWSLSLENDASESSADALRFADDLREKLENKSSEKSDKTAKRLKTLARHTQDFRTGVEDLGAFSHKLTRLKSRAGLDLAIPDSVQSAAAQHVQIMRIEGGFLQQELKNYIHEVYTALASTEELQRLVTLSDFVQTLQSLLKLEITRSDWNYLNELRRKIEWDQNEYSELDVTLFLTELEDRSNAARTFYLNAIDREKAMVKGISSMMLNGHGAPIGLVSGGFHTQGIRDYLDQKKISYVVVSPSIQTLPAENHYAEHMAGDVSWSRYLVPEQGILSFSKSFSRYIRDALISDEEDPQAFLNDWRLRLLSQTLQPSLQNSSSLSRSLELLNEVLESETGSGLNRWPWSDFTEFLDDMRRFGPNASAQGRQLAAPASTRPAEAVSAAVLSPEMVFTAGQIETWGSLPAGSLYHQTAVTQRRSEVRNAQLFQEEVIKKVSGTIDPSITIETKTNEKGQSELWLRHTAPYEEFRVQFTYRIIFSDTPVYRSSKYPKYSLEGETEKVNTLVVPKLADGEGWDKAALTVMGKMWRSMTIADPLLNMRFTTKGFKLAKYQKKAVHVLDQKVSLGGRSLGV